MFKKIISVFLLSSLILSVGCSSSEPISLEEKIRQGYIEHDRLEKFYELKERYDNKIILLINQKNDSYWITNFTLWLVFSILPDIPEVCATGSIIALFYAVAWWIGVTLTGGGILAVLAYIGGMLGGIPGIPPAICGIIFLGVMFGFSLKFFMWIF